MSDRASPQASGHASGLHEQRPTAHQNILSYNNFYKTRLCRAFQAGKCQFSNRCNYAHGVADLRPLVDLTKTKLCPRLQMPGGCLQPRCRYAHHLSELKATDTFYKTSLCIDFERTGRCRLGDLCRHAHGMLELKQKPASLYRVHKPGKVRMLDSQKLKADTEIVLEPQQAEPECCPTLLRVQPELEKYPELLLIEGLLKQENLLAVWDIVMAQVQVQQDFSAEAAGSTSAESEYERADIRPPPGLSRIPSFQRRRRRSNAAAQTDEQAFPPSS